jgi:hypothetical protein
MDSHMAVVNTASLTAAGLVTPADTAAAAADAQRLVDRDPQTGLPTGLLR